MRARREAQMQLDTLAADSIIITFTSISPPNDGAVFAQSNSNHAAQLKQLFSQVCQQSSVCWLQHPRRNVLFWSVLLMDAP